MSGAGPPVRALVAAAVIALALGCAAPQPRPRSLTAPAVAFVVPTTLSNGRIEVKVGAGYRIGTQAMIPITIVSAHGTISGPVAARIVASGIGERGSASEVLVATLAVTPVAATAGQTLATSVGWDGRDATGRLVPADAYTLLLDFRVEDPAGVTAATAGATLQWELP